MTKRRILELCRLGARCGALLFVLLTTAHRASAFCGFFVTGADTLLTWDTTAGRYVQVAELAAGQSVAVELNLAVAQSDADLWRGG